MGNTNRPHRLASACTRIPAVDCGRRDAAADALACDRKRQRRSSGRDDAFADGGLGHRGWMGALARARGAARYATLDGMVVARVLRVDRPTVARLPRSVNVDFATSRISVMRTSA